MSIFQNYPILVPLFIVIITEILKVVISSIKQKKLLLNQFFHSGGMPSAHASLVGSLLFVVYFLRGISSPEFAITGIFALIVVYDAMNVRMEAGKHALVLNTLQKKEQLDERLGHTVVEAVCGFLFGIIVAWVLLAT